MAKQKTSRFRGKAAKSMERPKNQFSYLNIPDNINVFKAEGGTEVIFDIIPYEVTDEKHMDAKKNEEFAKPGTLWWKRPLRVHRDVGDDGISIICPTTVGKPCPICEHGARRKKAGADWKGELQYIFPKNRTLFYIVPVDASECEQDYTEGDVHLFEMSDHLFLDLLRERADKDEAYEDCLDESDGQSLQVYFREKKLRKNTYAETSSINLVDREEQYDEDFCRELPSLDEMMKILSYKEIEALYFTMEGLDDEDLDHEEFEDEPQEHTGYSRKKKTSQHKTEKEPERRSRSRREEPEEEEEEEEEPEERKPRKRGTPSTKTRNTSRSRSRNEDEETEEEEEEEEPEEKKPRKSQSTRTRKTKSDPEDQEYPDCPHGHVFGEDTDQFDDCDKCKIWTQCAERNDELNQK